MYDQDSRHSVRKESEQQELQRYFRNADSFDPSKLTRNELEQADGTIVAKIPNIPGRISRRRKPNSSEYYIELITERKYDKASGQTRNKKTIIGTDISWALRGMMVINEKYHDYFDRSGRLLQQDLPQPSDTEIPDTQFQETETTAITPPDTKVQDTHQNTEISKEGADFVDSRSNPNTDEETIKQQKMDIEQEKLSLRVERSRLEKEKQELEQQRAELEDKRMEMIVHAEERNKDHLELLSSMLYEYTGTVEIQVKRRADKPMSLREIQTFNALFSELRTFFTNTEAEDYLKLAEEPQGEDHPGTTYGEMILLISAYRCAFNAYKWGNLWYKTSKQEEKT